jgi:hypothetical protein
MKCMHDGEAHPNSLVYLQLSSSKLYTDVPQLVLLISSEKTELSVKEHLAMVLLPHKLTLILLTWRIWWASNNASKWQMGFNLAFKELMFTYPLWTLRLRFSENSQCQVYFGIETRLTIKYTEHYLILKTLKEFLSFHIPWFCIYFFRMDCTIDPAKSSTLQTLN